MTAVIRILVIVNTFLTFSRTAIADEWFMPTPLAPVYVALAANDTQLAWQELQLALSQASLNEKYWLKAKRALIDKSHCGKHLTGDLPLIQQRHIRLIVQKKTNLAQQRLQMKVVLNKADRPAVISFRGQQGREWLFGHTTKPEQGYAELESEDLVTAPPPGLYQLSINNDIFPIVLSSDVESSWIQVNQSKATLPIRIRVPKTLASCQDANLLWQWFDHKFEMLGESQAIRLEPPSHEIAPFREVLLPEPYLNHAKWLSAVVSRSEYQGTVRVEYAQRFALPSKKQ